MVSCLPILVVIMQCGYLEAVTWVCSPECSQENNFDDVHFLLMLLILCICDVFQNSYSM